MSIFTLNDLKYILSLIRIQITLFPLQTLSRLNEINYRLRQSINLAYKACNNRNAKKIALFNKTLHNTYRDILSNI